MSIPKLSIVIAVYNEEGNVIPLIHQIVEALSKYDYEIIFVDDGSKDNTVSEIKSISNEQVTLLEFKRNFGQSLALAAGIDFASGEYIVTMDGDLQNDPSDIPMMLKIAEEGNWDLVAGERSKRKDGLLLRKLPSRIANALIRYTTKVKIKDYGCTLKIIKTDIAKELGLYGELHRFIPVLASLQGATITQVNVNHHPRTKGESKYGLSRTTKVISDLIFILFLKKHMQKPMHLYGTIGLITFLTGFIISVYLLTIKLLGNQIGGRPLLFLGVLLIIVGVQFFTFGIFTELQVRSYYESQGKKPFIIKKISIGGKEVQKN